MKINKLYNDLNDLYKELISTIDKAKYEVIFSIFHIENGWKYPKKRSIRQALVDACNRGMTSSRH